MTRKYTLVIEGDTGAFSAYVPELPSILVTGRSIDELSARAAEAIQIYWSAIRPEHSATSSIREIEVELPA
jgi:predicted RNase H-like HicB family nuclease